MSIFIHPSCQPSIHFIPNNIQIFILHTDIGLSTKYYTHSYKRYTQSSKGMFVYVCTYIYWTDTRMYMKYSYPMVPPLYMIGCSSSNVVLSIRPIKCCMDDGSFLFNFFFIIFILFVWFCAFLLPTSHCIHCILYRVRIIAKKHL